MPLPSDANPYSAPQTDPLIAGGIPFDATRTSWEPGEVIGVGYERFKQNVGTWIAVPLIGALIYLVPIFLTGAVMGMVSHGRGGAAPALVGGLLGLFLGSAVYSGLFTVSLAAARGNVIDIGTFFNGMSRLVSVLTTSLLVAVACGVGLILLVVPGIILGLGLSQALWFAIDRDMSPMDAAKASWDATMGEKGKIFVFGLLAGLVVLAGELACGIGLFVAIPVVMIAQATIYLRLSARSATPGTY